MESSQRRFHEIFSGRFVLFVVQKEFLRYQLYLTHYPASLTSYFISDFISADCADCADYCLNMGLY